MTAGKYLISNFIRVNNRKGERVVNCTHLTIFHCYERVNDIANLRGREQHTERPIYQYTLALFKKKKINKQQLTRFVTACAIFLSTDVRRDVRVQQTKDPSRSTIPTERHQVRSSYRLLWCVQVLPSLNVLLRKTFSTRLRRSSEDVGYGKITHIHTI